MKMPFEWDVRVSSKGLHGDRAHVYDEGGAVSANYTTLRGTTDRHEPTPDEGTSRETALVDSRSR